MGKKLLPFVCLLFFSVPIVLKLLQFEVNGTIDGWAHLFRQVLFNQALLDGQFPPRWAGGANFGFGAPIFLFYWSLPYYLVSLFMKLGMPLIAAAHIFLAFCTVLSGVFFYLFLRNYFDKFSSFIGATMYLYAPYRLMMTFLYESWGETLALTLGPLLLYWVGMISKKQTKGKILMGAVIIFLLIISHNGLALIFVTLAASLILAGFKVKVFKASVLSLFGGVVASSFFWMPTIFESKKLYISLLATSASRSPNFVSIPNMIKAGVESLQSYPAYFTSFTPGILIMVFGLLGFLAISIFLKKRASHASPLLWAGFWFLISYVLLAYQYDFLWEKIYFLKMLMYPYRILVITSVCGIFLTTAFLSLTKQYKYFFVFIIPVAVWAGLSFINPKIDKHQVDSTYFYNDQFPTYDPVQQTLMGGEDYLPKTVPREFLGTLQNYGKPANFIEGRGAKISGNVFRNSWKASFDIKTNSDTLGTVNLFNFEGWRGKINGEKVDLGTDSNGRITLPLTKGDLKVDLEFGETPLRLFAKVVSVLGTVLFLVFLALIPFV